MTLRVNSPLDKVANFQKATYALRYHTQAPTAPRVSVVLPIQGQRTSLAEILLDVPLWVDDIVVVDDERAARPGIEQLAALSAKVRFVRPDATRGAVRQGCAAATGDIIVLLDPAHSTSEAEIGRLVRKLRDGADFVKGSRFLQGSRPFDISRWERVANKALSWLVRRLYGGYYTDLLYGHSAFWARFIPKLGLDSTNPPIPLLHLRALSTDLKVVEVSSFGADPSLPRRTLPSGKPPRVSILIPTLNEEETLPHVLPHLPSWVDEVLLVDGYSTDRTVEVAQQLYPEVRVIFQEGKGKGAALRTGFKAARGDIVVMLDADGSTDPAEIGKFVRQLRNGADFVKGSRFIQGGGTDDMPRYRQFGNWVLVMLANVLFGTHYTDITYGYNATWRKHYPALALDIDGWACEIISNIRVARHGLHVVEVECFEHDRVAGEAKLQAFPAGWTILKAILRERFKRLEKAEPRDSCGSRMETNQ